MGRLLKGISVKRHEVKRHDIKRHVIVKRHYIIRFKSADFKYVGQHIDSVTQYFNMNDMFYAMLYA